MADRTDMRRRSDNGAIGPTAELDLPVTPGCVDGGDVPAAGQSGAVTALAQRLAQVTQELADSRQRGEQLKAALDKQVRRVHQLIGERDRLSSLLAARDGDLQQLNRELGALAARAEPDRVRSPALRAAARKLIDGVQRSRWFARPAGPAAPPAQRPEPRGGEDRLVPWLKHRPPRDVHAVVLFGLSAAEIARVLDAVERCCAEHDAAPLLLTDHDCFQLFRNRRVLFEFLPPPAEQQRRAPELDWPLFTLRRLALIRRKWRPSRIVPFGRQAAEVVRQWRESPFEDTPLPASPASPQALAGRAQPSMAA